MIFAVAALMVGAMGAMPADATTNHSTGPSFNSDLGTSSLFPSAATHNNSSTITSTTESGFMRLDLSNVSFDRNARAPLTASLTDSSSSASDQKSGFSTARLPDPEPTREHRITSAMETPSRRTWIALSVVQHGAAAFDGYSTRQSVGHGNVEEDPLMRPFANSPAIYVATQVTPVLLDILARHMQRSEYGMLRHVWWVPQSLGAGVSIFAGVHNLRLTGE
jgi:hypothetical protein